MTGLWRLLSLSRKGYRRNQTLKKKKKMYVPRTFSSVPMSVRGKRWRSKVRQKFYQKLERHLTSYRYRCASYLITRYHFARVKLNELSETRGKHGRSAGVKCSTRVYAYGGAVAKLGHSEIESPVWITAFEVLLIRRRCGIVTDTYRVHVLTRRRSTIFFRVASEREREKRENGFRRRWSNFCSLSAFIDHLSCC